MKGEKPYSWCQKVGIDKGLFQYYWQKGKIPTYENLIKIQKYTGCSLDWLLTGNYVDIKQIGYFPATEDTPVAKKAKSLREAKAMKKLQDVYASQKEKDIERLEGFLRKLVPAKKTKL